VDIYVSLWSCPRHPRLYKTRGPTYPKTCILGKNVSTSCPRRQRRQRQTCSFTDVELTIVVHFGLSVPQGWSSGLQAGHDFHGFLKWCTAVRPCSYPAQTRDPCSSLGIQHSNCGILREISGRVDDQKTRARWKMVVGEEGNVMAEARVIGSCEFQRSNGVI
jgi:hypothetical protein